jgi:hypothetical protein
MSARHSRPSLPETDGAFAGIVLVAANLLGLVVLASATGPEPVHLAVACDLPASDSTETGQQYADGHPMNAGPVSAKKDSGPAAPPHHPRGAARPA